MFKPNSSFCVLYTTDISKTHHFYQTLGFKIKEIEVDKVVVTFDSQDFHFILNTTEPSDSYKYIAQPGSYGQGVIFYIEAEDLEKAEQLIVSCGGIVKADIFNNHWGCQELLFEDPNGYKFALYQEV